MTTRRTAAQGSPGGRRARASVERAPEPPAISAPGDVVRTLVRLADLARREGLPGLDRVGATLPDGDEGFLRDALAEVVDGTPAAFIAEVMRIRIDELGERLERERQDRLRRLRMLLTGVLAIQAGEAPRAVRYKLATYLSPEARAALPDVREMLAADEKA